ncbi:hypothetical protein BDB00DRAFT_977814 [Zychaea mexicana]|uniref:uncharacterized protein n=1 Tax=Zychaea mexicana TaxID=64656 RepID=UPI0022FED934|nr:uncharacterized protein BDB00DRAFT_977814 [Zychaea mexicana]KAI9491807.1 hypothetical protein BDB00DRAFT_977814 [Zychaea mexicana]
MKIAWSILSTLTLCLVVALFAQDVNADAREQALAYLRKYKIPYRREISNVITSADNKLNKHDDDDYLLQTVKYYRDSVAMNVDLFGEKIDRILKGLRIKLEQQHQLTQNSIEGLMELLQHALRRLELRGELTRERVFAELDKLKHKAIEKKLVTEAQWKQLVNDVAGSFEADAWYRRFLGGRYHRHHHDDDQDDGFHRWKQHLQRRLKHNKRLTEAQIDQSLDTVQRAIHNTPDASKLADSRWWRRVERELKRNLVDPEQVKSVMDSVRDEVQAYKIFAMDYAPEEAKHWFSDWYDYIRDLYHEFFQWLYKQYNDEHTPEALKASSSYAVVQAHSRSMGLAVQSAESAAQSMTQAVQDTTQHWKDSFAKYWLQKEKQAYKRIGYTEAQLQWLHDHLEKTIKDRKSLAKHNVDASLYAIRRYLQETRVQSATQIEHQISRIQHLLEMWKQTLPTERVEL